MATALANFACKILHRIFSSHDCANWGVGRWSSPNTLCELEKLYAKMDPPYLLRISVNLRKNVEMKNKYIWAQPRSYKADLTLKYIRAGETKSQHSKVMMDCDLVAPAHYRVRVQEQFFCLWPDLIELSKFLFPTLIQHFCMSMEFF